MKSYRAAIALSNALGGIHSSRTIMLGTFNGMVVFKTQVIMKWKDIMVTGEGKGMSFPTSQEAAIADAILTMYGLATAEVPKEAQD
jgi:hypothetical protein